MAAKYSDQANLLVSDSVANKSTAKIVVSPIFYQYDGFLILALLYPLYVDFDR